MGYINPLLDLPAGRALMALPAEDRKRIEAVMRELRTEAAANAETAYRRHKGPMYAYWRAVSTYARHLAHALSRGGSRGEELKQRADSEYNKPDQLVSELPNHLAAQPFNDVLQRVNGDFDMSQGSRRSPCLEHDVGGGGDLQQDANLVERLGVDHCWQCTEQASPGRTSS